MTIHIGADHAGFHLKEYLRDWLVSQGNEVVDHGAKAEEELDDYPDIIGPVAQAISQNPNAIGIVIGGSGQGEAIVSNRYPKVRAAVYYGGPEQIVTLAREHNDANILSLGARFLTPEQAKKVVQLFLSTPFRKETRHGRRIAKIELLNPNK